MAIDELWCLVVRLVVYCLLRCCLVLSLLFRLFDYVVCPCGTLFESSWTCKHSRHVAVQRLTQFVRGGDAVWYEVDAPRTCADWYMRQLTCKKALMQVCSKGVPRLPIEGGELAYFTSWTIRGGISLVDACREGVAVEGRRPVAGAVLPHEPRQQQKLAQSLLCRPPPGQ